MKKFLMSFFLVLITSSAFAGGPSGGPEQMTLPQTKVVVVTPPSNEKEWVTPVIVASLGFLGVMGAAWISSRNKS